MQVQRLNLHFKGYLGMDPVVRYDGKVVPLDQLDTIPTAAKFTMTFFLIVHRDRRNAEGEVKKNQVTLNLTQFFNNGVTPLTRILAQYKKGDLVDGSGTLNQQTYMPDDGNGNPLFVCTGKGEKIMRNGQPIIHTQLRLDVAIQEIDNEQARERMRAQRRTASPMEGTTTEEEPATPMTEKVPA